MWGKAGGGSRRSKNIIKIYCVKLNKSILTT